MQKMRDGSLFYEFRSIIDKINDDGKMVMHC